MKLSKMHKRVKANAPYQSFVTDITADDAVKGFYGRWGWEGPNKQDKGLRLGSCNVTACQQPGAYWYNRTMTAWYCTSCAHEINYRPLPNGEYLCILNEEARKEYYDALENDPE